MKFLFSIFLSLFLFGIIFSSFCPLTNTSFYVPAVVGDGGGLVKANIALINGSGKIFVSTTPKIGETTQESLEESLEIAKSLSNHSFSCDYLISFDSNFETKTVDGPSAGVAFTVNFFGILNNLTPRSDTIITGAIDSSGRVLPVGGVYEKSYASSLSNFKYFLSPSSGIYEVFLLKKIETNNPIKTYRFSNLGEVFGFMFENKSISNDNLTTLRPLPNITTPYPSHFDQFSNISLDMSNLLEKELDSISPSVSEYDSINLFYQNELARAKILSDNEYYFSAANDAFLNYIDLLTLKGIFSTIDLNSKKKSIESCLSQIKRPNADLTNYEFVFGSDLRFSWAKEKIAQTNLSYSIYEEQISLFNDLSYSQAWCEVSKSIAKNTPIANGSINESLLENLASDYQNKISNISTDSDDLNFRIKTSKNLFNDKKYGASLLDAQYVLTNYNLNSNPPSNITNVSSFILSFENRTASSLWSELYYSQSKYLLQNGDLRNSLRLAILSGDLADLNSKIRFALEKDHQNVQNSPVLVSKSIMSGSDGILFVIFGFLALIILILLILRAFKGGKSDGRRYQKYR